MFGTQKEAIMQTSVLSRRDFVLGTAAAAACAAAARRIHARSLSLPIGLQLYSVRDLLPKDFNGTLARLHAIGYTVVEAAGYYDRSAKEFRGAMDQAGLRCVSAHETYKRLEANLDEILDYSHRLGLEYLVCSSSIGTHYNPNDKGEPTIDDWRRVAGEFNRIGEKVRAAGMTFGVHNHTPELAVIDGVLVYDELLRLTDPKLVYFEMDVGWVAASGHDQVAYLRKSPERFPLMHVKDMVKDANGRIHSTEMGRGTVKYEPVMRAATALKYYFIEQEEFDIDPMEALRIDAEYMKKL